ncbi:hypothetical protein H0H93_011350, partial [Arthromyces matolae]
LDIGSIKQPIELTLDAFDLYDYCNTRLEDALIDAYPHVLRIVSGSAPHPIMTLFSLWCAKGQGQSEFHALTFPGQFSLPVLPADRSIINAFVGAIR